MISGGENRLRVLGIRHHGSGSARAVREALTAEDPDIVLIEGPPEADALVAWVDRGLVPPVAVLAYDVVNPSTAIFWPFAVFSPEWQALTWAVEHGRPVRFIDLPAAVTLADLSADNPRTGGEPAREQSPEPARTVRDDPMALLARASGYSDPERWWEEAIESQTSRDLFDSLMAAVVELRRGMSSLDDEDSLTDARREAHMRLQTRAALSEHDTVAVVCGAWHAPAFAGRWPSAEADSALIAGLPRVAVAAEWVPWTHSRLAHASGYGAGISAPGWYRHLFATDEAVIESWFAEVAAVLRHHDLPISPTQVAEATQLATALAEIHDRPRPGLEEAQEAALAVMCDGRPSTLAVVTRELVVGEELGHVPPEAPLVALDADLRARANCLRLPMAATPRNLVLDLRQVFDRQRSRLLHMLTAIGIDWGVRSDVPGLGAHKEAWVLEWSPDYSVAIVVASAWGSTVAEAAAAKLTAGLTDTADVTARIELAMLADLDDAVTLLLTELDRRTSEDVDVATLLAALPALVRAQRHEELFSPERAALRTISEAVSQTVFAALPDVLAAASADSARRLAADIDALTDVVELLPAQDVRRWRSALRETLERGGTPAFVAGRLTRTLFDDGELTATQARIALTEALTSEALVADRAAFAEGFLSASAQLLIHDNEVLSIVDDWMTDLSQDDFAEVLPILRRAFVRFNRPERTAIAERASRLHLPGQTPPPAN